MKKKLVVFFSIFIAILFIFAIKCEAASISASSGTIYAVSPSLLEEYPELEIPSKYPQSFKIEVTGTSSTPTFQATENAYMVNISEDGTVTPRLGSSDYYYGEVTIQVSVDSQQFEVKVEVKNYSTTYADNIIDEFIAENINDTMTDMEKLNKIAEYTASFNYSISSQSYVGMIITGGGDCWASTSMVCTLARKLGFSAHSRYAASDSGAGSGHMNAAVLIDGTVYIVEAGYNMTPPRYYYIYAENTGFDFEVKSDGTLLIKQYDGFETDIVVPSEYGGRTVTEIGEYCFPRATIDPVTITLPDTITTLNEACFGRISTLEQVNIPDSVTTINGAPFVEDDNLEIIISENHPYFLIENSTLYNKDKTELIEYIGATTSETFEVPDTVKKITAYAFYGTDFVSITMNDNVEEIGKLAFYYTTKLTSVKLSKSITTIEEETFFSSAITSIELSDNIISIGDHAFGNTPLKGITIPKSVQTIDDYAFYASSIRSCVIEEGSTVSIGTRAFIGCNLLAYVKIPETVTDIADDAFYNLESKVVIYGKENSPIQTYAEEREIQFVVDNDKKIIINKMIFIENTKVDYTGETQKPKIYIYYGGTILKEGEDYICTYPEDTINVGTKEVTITCIGEYTGEDLSTSYEIKKISNVLEIICEDVLYGNKPAPVVVKNTANLPVTFMYSKIGSNVWTSSKPTSVGEYKVMASTGSSGNYMYTSTTITFSITEPNYTLGDINNDGKINTLDAIMALQHISHKITLTDEQELAADTSKDGNVNTLDIIKILQYISKKITEF